MVTTTAQATPRNTDPSKLVSFEKWLEGLSLTRTTGYRYRKNGLIKAINIFGRLYITKDEIESFERRAIAGEFDKNTSVKDAAKPRSGGQK